MTSFSGHFFLSVTGRFFSRRRGDIDCWNQFSLRCFAMRFQVDSLFPCNPLALCAVLCCIVFTLQITNSTVSWSFYAQYTRFVSHNPPLSSDPHLNITLDATSHPPIQMGLDGAPTVQNYPFALGLSSLVPSHFVKHVQCPQIRTRTTQFLTIFWPVHNFC